MNQFIFIVNSKMVDGELVVITPFPVFPEYNSYISVVLMFSFNSWKFVYFSKCWAIVLNKTRPFFKPHNVWSMVSSGIAQSIVLSA